MGYSLKSLKDELCLRNLADGGLVAWGQSASAGSLFGAVGGAIAGVTSPKYVISMIKNSQIAFFPFTNKEIKYNEMMAFDRTQITMAKISGLFSKTLKLTMVDGKRFSFPIMQGVGDLKKILLELGL